MEEEKPTRRNINDFIEVELSLLKPGQAIPCNLYLYFERNDHIIKFRQKEEVPSVESLEKYVLKGLRRVWVDKSEYGLFKEYVNGNPTVAPQNTSEERNLEPSFNFPTNTAPEVPLDLASTLMSPLEISLAVTPEKLPNSPHDKSLKSTPDTSLNSPLENSLIAAQANSIDSRKPSSKNPASESLLNSPLENSLLQRKGKDRSSPQESSLHLTLESSLYTPLENTLQTTQEKYIYAPRDSSSSPNLEFSPNSVLETSGKVHHKGPTQLPTSLILEQSSDKDPTPGPPASHESIDNPAEKLIKLFRNSRLPPEEKSSQIAVIAKSLIRLAIDPALNQSQSQANSTVRKIIKQTLDTFPSNTVPLIQDTWEFTDTHDTCDHSANVATFAVIVSMAYGKTDQNLLCELALAGLLHDVGLSQISIDAISTPWKTLSPENQKTYSHHVEAGFDLISQSREKIPDRVPNLILYTHEKYDGSGYPRSKKKFNRDDLAQYLAIAEMLDSISKGQWDGEHRNYKDALDVLLSFEKNPTEPSHFDPNILNNLKEWALSDIIDHNVPLAA